ncbi:MAG: multidrug efflux SMR transporter [Rickettsiales bacterium]
MAWLYLLIAGIFEISWAVGIKYCDSSKLNFILFFVILSMMASVFFLWLALKSIPISLAYAIWTGIGILGVVTYDIIVFKQPLSLINLIFISLILIGIIGLKLNQPN